MRTEIERVELKGTGSACPPVTEAAVLLKLLLFVSEGFYCARNLSPTQMRLRMHCNRKGGKTIFHDARITLCDI
jgi:hypothetical protein